MWNGQARLNEIGAELETLLHDRDKTLNDPEKFKRLEALNREGERLLTQKSNHAAALRLGDTASPESYGMSDTNPSHSGGFGFKGIGIPGLENQIAPPSMYAIDKSQIAALKQAAQQRMPFKVTIGSKGLEHGFMGGIRDKAAITEGGLTPNLLPVTQQYGPNGWFQLPYEMNSVQRFLPNIPFDSAGVGWFLHASNGSEAAYVQEGQTKPDLTPVVQEQYTRPSKIAGRVNITHELLQDAGDTFASHLTTELARSIYNATNNILLNGTTAGNGFNGINQVSGTLTQAIGSDSPLDCISKAIAALRADFFEPDLILMHSNTLGALRRIKDLNNRYVLDMLTGPRGIDQTNEQENLWGVPVVQTTQQAAGTAAVLSVKSGAAVVYVREALTTFFDPYSQASSNIYQFVSEQRLALATPRPSAICLVSGLPTS